MSDARADLCEAINAAIRDRFDGDNCQSRAHLMRVPGTINWPTPAKVKRGRSITQATLLQPDNGTTVTLEQMAAALPPDQRNESARPMVDVGEFCLLSADDLNLSALDDLRFCINEPDCEDRSKDAFRLAYRMAERGYSDEQIVGVLLNPDNAVAAHCVENGNPTRAAVRTLSAAKGVLAKHGGAVARPANSELTPLVLIDAGTLVGVAVAPRNFMVAELIPADLVTMFTAPGGGGKSHISLYLAACVALGALAYGLLTMQAPAIYITAEDDADENHRRLIGVANALNTGIEALAGKLFLASLVDRRDKGLVRIDANSNKMSILPLFEELRLSILTTGAKLVVLDNVAHLFEGNENIRAHVAAFIGLLNALALETHCAIILISHPNKAGDSFSGSTAFQNQVRSHIHLEVDADDADARLLTLVKANYARLDEPMRLRWHRSAFRLESEIASERGGASTILTESHDARFLACLDKMIGQSRPVSMSPQGRATYAPKMFVGLNEAGGMKSGQIAAAMKRLLDGGVIEHGELEFNRPGTRSHKAVGLRRTNHLEADNERM